jgi:hypothetical protein
MGSALRWFIGCLLFALAASVMAFKKMTVCSWMQKSGSNNLGCGRISWRGRLFDKSSGMAEQSVVASHGLRLRRCTVPDRLCLDRTRQMAEASRGRSLSYPPSSSSIPAISDNACLFPVRVAASTPLSSIFFASAVRPLRSSVCAAMK